MPAAQTNRFLRFLCAFAPALLWWLPLAAYSADAASDAYAKLTETLTTVTDSTGAQKRVEAFVAEHPDHLPGRLLLARQALLNDAPITALEALAPLLTETQADWQPWFWAGTAYLAQGEIEVARTHLQRSLAKGSDRAVIWNQLAVLEQESGNFGGSLTNLDIALQLDPGFAVSHLNRAYTLERLGRFEQALEAYRSYLIQPGRPTAQSQHARVIGRIQELTRTLTQLEAATDLRPGETQSQDASGIAADSAGDS